MDDARLLHEITALLAPEDARAKPSLADVEHTLTTGYARAHALEAEQLRLDRKIAEVAELLAAEGAATYKADLRALSTQRARADDELKLLRGLLRALRERAAALRAP